MSQRSYSNERYRKDAKIGSTRKSAAAAKPIRKQGDTAPATSKPKPKKNEVEKDWAGMPTSPAIKMWRRVWWVLLLGGLVLVAANWYIPSLKNDLQASRIVLLAILALSGAAIYIDLVVIRRLRNEIAASVKKPKKNGKDEK